MLDFFRRLLGIKKKSAPATANTQKKFAALNEIAPLKNGEKNDKNKNRKAQLATNSIVKDTDSPNASFVCREPVLDRKERIAGYIFDLQEALRSRLQGREGMLHRAYDDALLRSLSSLGIASLLEHRLAFVNLTPASLDNPLILQLPPQNTVLMLRPGSNPLEPEKILTQLKVLDKNGFAYGWVISKKDLVTHQKTLAPLALRSNYIQLETASFDGREIQGLHKALTSRRTVQQGKLHLLANDLDSFDEFNLCFERGFDFFTGNFVTSRENWHPPKSDINRMLAIKLLNLLRTDEELKVIADQITADPIMTFKLLRYLNSPAIGLQNPILTIDKALLILGRERCFRWLSLLLFDIKQSNFRERLLTEQALTRAFFLESLAGLGKVPKDKDALFILGLFSMLDLLMGMPMAELLEQTQLPEALHQALLGQPSEFLAPLELAKAEDKQHAEKIPQLAAACGVNALQILERTIEALSKAHTTMSLHDG